MTPQRLCELTVHFEQRPEIRVPKFEVTVHDAKSVTPGYWFVGPYALISQEKQPKNYYQACQTGPAIYDNTGELVWSGACHVRNQNTCDFRVSTINGTSVLSMILYQWGKEKGHGLLLDGSYSKVQRIDTRFVEPGMNMHELNIMDNGRSALIFLYKPARVDVRGVAHDDSETGWISDMGFREFDLASGDTIFEWWASPHISVEESTTRPTQLEGPYPQGWDWFHGNSLDRNDDGDYLVCARHTDAIYKISGVDGQIMWRLGGVSTDFAQDFLFARQHDARFLPSDDGGKTELISFFDNGGDEYSRLSNQSAGLVVRLDTTSSPMTARVEKQYRRPDGNTTDVRGNFHMLPNGNVVGGWSGPSYVSEHTADGKVVLEARFKSDRFVTYRTYKFNFTGTPSEPPVVHSSVFGTSSELSTTVTHVSWSAYGI